MTIKNIIVPIQAWLLSQGRCLGCGESLEGARRQRKNGSFVVWCKCKRAFTWDTARGVYRQELAQHQQLYLREEVKFQDA